jgi:prephenate dehydratase
VRDVSFQGEPGAYSDLACRELLGEGARTLPCRTFAAAFDAVRDGRSRYALVPAENSTAGTVHDVFDLLLRRRLRVLAEHFLRVEHCLLVPRGSSVADVRRVYSHPQALAQCERFVRRLGAEPRAVYDTAGGARRVARGRSGKAAAIASHLAARLYELRVTKRAIQDEPNNVTRFLLLGPAGRAVPEAIARSGSGERKASLVFETRHHPGALVRALSVFSESGINLTKIESRPIVKRPFEYLFYVDVRSARPEHTLEAAIGRLRRVTVRVRLLGVYAPGAPPGAALPARRRSRRTTSPKLSTLSHRS